MIDALEAKKDDLAGFAHNSLIETEDHYLAELDRISEKFGEQINLLSEVEVIMGKAIGEEILPKWGKHNDTGGDVKHRLADCMEEYYNTASQQDENLGPLWKQWLEVQAELIGLTVEILGEKGVDVAHHTLYDQLAKTISESSVRRKKIEGSYINAEQSMDDIKLDLVDLCNETTTTVKAQQKASHVPWSISVQLLMSVLADLESRAKEDAEQHQGSYG